VATFVGPVLLAIDGVTFFCSYDRTSWI